MKKLMLTGTLKDKISALCIHAKDNAQHSIKTLENLMKIVNKKKNKKNFFI